MNYDFINNDIKKHEDYKRLLKYWHTFEYFLLKSYIKTLDKQLEEQNYGMAIDGRTERV